MSHTSPGRFLVFEGIDGCGKTTQIHRVAAHLRAQGVPVTLVREPGGTPTGETVRALLKAPENALTPEAELFLFSAARSQVVSEVIRPALARGDVVLCDRFTLSTLAYQGAGRGLPMNLVEDVCKLACDSLTPDLTIYLGMTLEASRQRACARAALDRFELAPSAFHERVLRFYESAVSMRAPCCKVVNGMQSEDEVFREICEVLGI